jgi:hypothetical protein
VSRWGTPFAPEGKTKGQVRPGVSSRGLHKDGGEAFASRNFNNGKQLG